MKIIDLINKRAKGEEMPNEIKNGSTIYQYCEIANDYRVYRDADEPNYWLFRDYVFGGNGNRLNNEIEILEEVEDKEYEDIEEITIRDKTIGFPNGEWTARNMDKAFSHKINALIRNQKKIIERLDK
jgi:hypothetical protein